MSGFVGFAASHGLIIDSLESGRWVRVPTTDHPRKRNGTYFFAGDYGHLQNWAEMTECVSWIDDREYSPVDRAALVARMAASRKVEAANNARKHATAAAKAAVMIAAAGRGTHQYLIEKGLDEAIGLVSADSDLLIPMRGLDGALRGVQVIRLVDNAWEKKMLFGMAARGAMFRIGQQSSETWFVEGYATGLSVSVALKMLRSNASVIVCFSAQNMVQVASSVGGRRFIFADNDASNAGETAAQQAGLPYCMPDESGMDANDLHKSEGVVSVAKKIISTRKSA